MTARMVSVIVPVRERPEALAELYEEYSEPLRRAGLEFEFVFVCQPWFEQLATPLLELARGGEPIRILQLGQGAGEATMLKVGAQRARGDRLVTLPGYRRVRAPALLDLVAALDHTDMALAVRWPRSDSWINRVQNGVFHRIVGVLAGSSFRDLACGVRAMRRPVIEETPLYGDFYRFLPLLAQREGFRVAEVEAEQHPGDDPPRVYSAGVYVRRFIDLLGMYFLLRFTEKPLRFFGLVGSAAAFIGFALLAVVTVQRLGGEPLADRPVLLLGVLLIVLGVQAVALGLIGEMIVFHHAHQKPRYRLAQRVPESSLEARDDGDRPGPHDASPPERAEPTSEVVALRDPGQPARSGQAYGGGVTAEEPGRVSREDPATTGASRSPDPRSSEVHVKRNTAAWLRLAVGLGLLALLLSRVDLSERTILLDGDVVFGIALTGLLLLGAQAVSALRWREILGASAPGWGYLFRLYLIGNFFSLFLPTSVGGDAVRAVAASRALPPRTPAVTSVVVDRLIGVGALFAYLLIGFVLAPTILAGTGAGAEWHIPGPLAIGVAAAALAVLVLVAPRLARRPWLRRRLGPALTLLRRLRDAPRELAWIVVLGLVVQGLYIVAWALLAAALDLRLPPALFVAAVPLVSLLAMLPVSVSGLGVREGAWLLLLAPFGVAPADAVAYSLIFFLSFVAVGVIGGVVYSISGTSLRPLSTEAG